jgi:hypothetical protein
MIDEKMENKNRIDCTPCRIHHRCQISNSRAQLSLRILLPSHRRRRFSYADGAELALPRRVGGRIGFGVAPGKDAIGICRRMDGAEVGEEVAEWPTWVLWEEGSMNATLRCGIGLFGGKSCRIVSYSRWMWNTV